MWKYYHVRNSIEEGFVKVEFIVSEENYMDMSTKNVCQAVYDEHKDVMIFNKKDLEN